ncbi:hypothetical protein [Candidatus Nanohalococcus occultus]
MRPENYILLVSDEKNYLTTSETDLHTKEGMIEKQKLEKRSTRRQYRDQHRQDLPGSRTGSKRPEKTLVQTQGSGHN